ncbi:hypothetical protein AOP6_1480 [Desulfuromonas sp. AOP6]|nr:hypothetical protein AOP6_1480 [Desulfuromonas sp. AOP6]
MAKGPSGTHLKTFLVSTILRPTRSFQAKETITQTFMGTTYK